MHRLNEFEDCSQGCRVGGPAEFASTGVNSRAWSDIHRTRGEAPSIITQQILSSEEKSVNEMPVLIRYDTVQGTPHNPRLARIHQSLTQPATTVLSTRDRAWRPEFALNSDCAILAKKGRWADFILLMNVSYISSTNSPLDLLLHLLLLPPIHRFLAQLCSGRNLSRTLSSASPR